MKQRRESAYEKHELPSRFWEPQPDEEDLERMEQNADKEIDDEPIPFE